MSVKDWINHHAVGKTFADMGGLWNTVNEQVTVAAMAGATSTTMIDMQSMDHPLWQAFYARCATYHVVCNQSLCANLDAPDFPNQVGTYDVVHCSGVIYHTPNPLYSVQQLTKITKEVLILNSTIIPGQIENAAGSLTMASGSALFVPGMNSIQKLVVLEHFRSVAVSEILGLASDFEAWDISDYAPWYWLFTVEHIKGLLRALRWTVQDELLVWNDHAVYLLAYAPGFLPQKTVDDPR